MNKDNYNKIQALIESGVKENIILAFQLAKLEKIPVKEIMIPWRHLRFSAAIKGNSIEDVTFKVLNLKELRINLLRPNFPKELPIVLIKLNLEKLIILSSKDKTLPEFIGKIISLKDLDLSHNKIERLPDSIGNLKNLEKLTLNRNQSLSYLPDSIGDLKNLEYLNLDNNALKSLPKTIINLPKLKYINIHGNQIQKLPSN
jgi:Leucine-rich repeat (LRR) protein